MTDDDYEISEEPPRDEQGHPIHPERGHRICGATKSDKTTPTDHGRERDDVDYCLLAAGWGENRDVGPCSKHPVTGEQWGESNPNYDTGSYSEFQRLQRESLTEREQEMLDALDLDEHADDFAKDVVKEAYLKYHRTGDDRFLREARQWAKEFGVIASPADEIEVQADVNQTTEHQLGDDERELALETIRELQERDAGE
ncbi:hypothetical protein BDK61_2645 [Haloarcula quadrata]|uniref:Uncharacterized protein n=1 Tax=Haloarcula quadrata TaxID=182779 RepID=A0A495R7Q5_9EURY|nr:hypothetical protein [Haloarcula quadrata]RKS83302.1 hypothetical protein BDK61_2645 [Haloarcula quadrata]